VDDYTLDANAVAGMLDEVFGKEMTAQDSQCAHCGNRAQVGTLRAFDLDGPGVILRCGICSGIMLVMVRRPDGSVLVEASGTVDLQP
jgi:DNA-directed RNA polymerase subunit RPC12/RpoP